MKKNTTNSERGVTLVEILIATVITFVVGGFLVATLVNQTGIFYQQSSIVNQGVSLNDVMARINSDIRESSAIAVSVTYNSVEYTTGSDSVIFELPAYNSQGILSGVSDYIVIKVDDENENVLRRLVLPDQQSLRSSSNTVLTSILESVEYIYLDSSDEIVQPSSASKVSATVTVLARTGSIGSPRSSTIVTSLRNL
jgi:Tfp pilus assembly protein FimT